MNIGIESISFYTPRYCLDLNTLAQARGEDRDKFYVGIGQERMAVLPPGEDVITMGASAAAQALEGVDKDAIDTVFFATESSIDQSKSGAVYIHRMLGLSPHCRSVELKQACCSATAALLMARAWVAQRPTKKVLIVAADVARYELNTPGEATQGAGAVALVISAQPRLMTLEPESGAFTEDVMDFWRPNYREEAFVDGKYSIRVYLRALAAAWQEYTREAQRDFAAHYRFCYHLPFTKMGEKAHTHLSRINGMELTYEQILGQMGDSQQYNRLTGNTYTASLYIGLCSLLENSNEDLEGRRVGLFSYGSGCVGMFFSGVVSRGYRAFLHAAEHRRQLRERTELSLAEYEAFYHHHLPEDGSDYEMPVYQTGPFWLTGLSQHKRLYVANVSPAVEARANPVARVIPVPVPQRLPHV